MDPDSEKTDDDVSSKCTLQMNSPWQSNPSMQHLLIDPMYAIPLGFLDAADAPLQFVIGVNTADLLYAKELQLTQSLQEIHNATAGFVRTSQGISWCWLCPPEGISQCGGYAFDPKVDSLAAALQGKRDTYYAIHSTCNTYFKLLFQTPIR